MISSEKNATAPNSDESNPRSMPTQVVSALTEAACEDGIPPIPAKRVKSGCRWTSQLPTNLISCALSSVTRAIVSAGNSTRGFNLLPIPLYGEPAQACQRLGEQPGGIQSFNGRDRLRRGSLHGPSQS